MQYLSHPKDLTWRYFIGYRGLCTYQFVLISASFTGDFNTKKKSKKTNKQIQNKLTKRNTQYDATGSPGCLSLRLSRFKSRLSRSSILTSTSSIFLREMLIMHVVSQHQYLLMLSNWYSLLKQAPQDIWLILHWI